MSSTNPREIPSVPGVNGPVSPTIPVADPPPVADAPADAPADVPPAKSRRRAAGDKAPGAGKTGRPSKDDVLQKQIADFVAVAFGMGSAVTAGTDGVGAPGSVSADFAIVANQAQPLAAALVKVSKTNPAVRKALEMAVSTGAYSELATVVLAGIALPIMANHQLLPPAIGGIYGAAASATPTP
jgi:hypothetical protein